MIDAYFWPTPNGWKLTIALEEMGLDYQVKPVDITKGDQFSDAYLEINPNGKMPTIVDHEPDDGNGPVSVFESGAILWYLAEKSGLFLPKEPNARTDVMAWLFWQSSGMGPMFGQSGHFKFYAPEKIPYAIERYEAESLRIYGVLDKRLAERDYICGDVSIADFATWPWVLTYKAQKIDLGQFPNVRRWYDNMKVREGLRRGYVVGREFGKPDGNLSDEAKKVLMSQKTRE